MNLPHELLGAFPARPTGADKRSVGVVTIVGGSARYANAPVVAGLGARAAGAGLVQLVVPRESRHCAGALLPEATFTELVAELDLPRADVVAAGMGLGISASSEVVVERLLGLSGRLVLDADALSILASCCANGRYRPTDGQELVLTPHEGEAARLLGVLREEVASDRRGAVLEIASRYGATAVLKGPGTLVAAADGSRIYENGTGNPFMALGGMGDLLAGAIAARWARIKGPAFDAAAGAVWLHGAASDALVGDFGDPSLVGTAAAIGSLRVRLETGAGKQNKETDNDGNNKL